MESENIMRTISTQAELDAVPLGALVSPGDASQWERVAAGVQHTGTRGVLPTDMFGMPRSLTVTREPGSTESTVRPLQVGDRVQVGTFACTNPGLTASDSSVGSHMFGQTGVILSQGATRTNQFNVQPDDGRMSQWIDQSYLTLVLEVQRPLVTGDRVVVSHSATLGDGGYVNPTFFGQEVRVVTVMEDCSIVRLASTGHSNTINNSDLTLVEQPTPDLGVTVASGTAFVTFNPTVTATSPGLAGITEAQVRVREEAVLADYRERLGAALSEYLSDQDGLAPWEREGLTDVMGEFDLAHEDPNTEIEVEVYIDGETDVEMDSDSVGNYIDSDLTADSSVDFTASWNVTLSKTVTVCGDACGCDQVDGDFVAEMLSDNNISYGRVTDYTASCPND